MRRRRLAPSRLPCGLAIVVATIAIVPSSILTTTASDNHLSSSPCPNPIFLLASSVA
ncbi:YdcF family protein [Sesbania bispinosa]|nr:YdcF family protein [Sesbania bispinosa]